MEQKVFVVGHRNPDTDSICSAIAYADLKRHMHVDAVAARAGRISRETKFVLDYFGVEEPAYLPTAKAQVSNLKMDLIDPISRETSLINAWKILRTNNLKSLPVEDDDHKLCGMISVSDIANAYMDMPHDSILSRSSTPLHNVIRTLRAKLLCGGENALIGSGKAVIVTTTPQSMDACPDLDGIVLIGKNKDTQIRAIETGAFCIIITRGSDVDADILDAAGKKGCILLVTEYDTITAARLLYQSIPAGHVMTTKKLVMFHQDDYLDEVKEKMLQTRYRSYPVVDGDDRFLGFISRYHLINQSKNQLILVDHSEQAQSVVGVEQAEILEIIDHHRIGDIQTGSPIYYRNEPVGSSATIVANLYFENKIEPSPQIAGILCAAILSDTVAFKSPTSTDKDVETAQRLADICGIDTEKFAVEMFHNGFSLKNMTPGDMIHSDFKEYKIGSAKIGIGQVNTADLTSVKKFRKPVLQEMSALIENSGYSTVLLLITDIINEETEVLFVETKKGRIAKGFNPLNDENSFYMKGVVSRKKQIVPVINKIFTEI